jgi:putative pyruvate formate lyase activating enzyme
MHVNAKKSVKLPLIEGALRELVYNYSCCRLCPRMCQVNRHAGETGFCGIAEHSVVSHYCLHFGEEPPLSGYRGYNRDSKTRSRSMGSGTVFFAGCNLKCIYCQNYQISWNVRGSITSPDRLSALFIQLQEKGALNINLVTPTHVILLILEALRISISRGLKIPIVYNTSAYDAYMTIARLSGIIDIYLPDLKYLGKETARRLSSAPDYPERAREVIKEMYAQVGDLVLDEEGNAQRGIIIRHLVLPGYVDESCAILEWIAGNLSTRVCVSIMSQFSPCTTVPDEINRRITRQEYETVLRRAKALGFENLYLQPFTFQPGDHLLPDFDRDDPFSWADHER